MGIDGCQTKARSPGEEAGDESLVYQHFGLLENVDRFRSQGPEAVHDCQRSAMSEGVGCLRHGCPACLAECLEAKNWSFVMIHQRWCRRPQIHQTY